MTTNSNQSPKDETTELAEVKDKVQRLAKQLNYYIQLNGCSKRLKQKANSKLGVLSEPQPASE